MLKQSDSEGDTFDSMIHVCNDLYSRRYVEPQHCLTARSLILISLSNKSTFTGGGELIN